MHAALDELKVPPIVADIFRRSGRLPLTVRTAVMAILDPYGSAITDLTDPEQPVRVNWSEFEALVAAAAARLEEAGGGPRMPVTVSLPNGIAHFVATHAAWRTGATVVPLDPRLPAYERDRLRAELPPHLAIGDWAEADLSSQSVRDADSADSRQRPEPLAVRLAAPYAILPTGGSTGRPRLIEKPGPLWGRFDAPPEVLGQRYGILLNQVHLVSLPLHHGFGFGYANAFGLAYGHHLIVTGRFYAGAALDAIERYRVQYCPLVPAMMGRMARDEAFRRADLSSLQALLHAAAPCPPNVKHAWISRIGAERVYEAYGATDLAITCTIRGDEWLARPGSVGQPEGDVVRIVDEAGQYCLPGVIGKIVLASDESGAPPRAGGDLGYFDLDGYLYLCGRSNRIINSGGSKLVPETIEMALSEHEMVRDVRVRSVPDEDLGEVAEALVALEPGEPDLGFAREALRRFCQDRLPPELVPRIITITTDVGRADTGKLRADTPQQRSMAETASP